MSASKLEGRQRMLVVMLACTAMFIFTTTALAGILPLFSGNHRAVAEADSSLDASLSFAVFELGGGNGDLFGTGRPGFDASFISASGFPTQLDTSAQYLYVYQYVNDGTGTRSFDSLGFPAKPITSLGYWNWGLRDSNGPVEVGNPFGTNTFGFQPAASPELGVVAGVVAETSVADKVPALSYFEGALTAEFNLLDQESTALFGFTSNLPPVIRRLTPDICPNIFSCGSFVTPISADFDIDGEVDEADLAHWRDNYGTNGSDADGDNDTDGSDFLAWQRQYTGNENFTATASSIPEPSTGVLLLGLALTLHLSRSKNRGLAHTKRAIFS